MKRSVVWLASAGFDLLVLLPWFVLYLLWGEKLRWDGAAQLLIFEWKRGSLPLGGSVDPETGLLRNSGGAVIRGWYLQNRRAAMEKREVPHTWGATVLGHLAWCGPDMWSRPSLRAHETQHRHQAEAWATGSFLWAVAVAGLLWALGHPSCAICIGAAMWSLGGYATMGPAGWFVAWLNNDPAGWYRGSAHERGAYGVGDHVRLREEAAEHMRFVHGVAN